MSTCIRLTVTLSIFLDIKQSEHKEKQNKCHKMKLSHAVKTLWQQSDLNHSLINEFVSVTAASNEMLTCSHSPTPLSVPFTSHWHSGMRERERQKETERDREREICREKKRETERERGREKKEMLEIWGNLHWIDSDYRILSLSRVKCNSTQLHNL